MRLISSFGLVSFGVVGTWWFYGSHNFADVYCLLQAYVQILL